MSTRVKILFRVDFDFFMLTFLVYEGTGLDGACHRLGSYMVETWARVMELDMGGTFDRENAVQRQPSWDLTRRQSNEHHGGLLSWPEHAHRVKLARGVSSERRGQEQRAQSFSDRAMEIGFFGSMVVFFIIIFFLIFILIFLFLTLTLSL